MRQLFWACVVFVCAATFAITVEPQHADTSMVNWLAGSWKGDAFGGTAEEIWSQPVGGTMMGMFRLIKDGKVSFSEFEEIVDQDSGLVFRVKHFTSAFVGWEEKDKSIDFKFLSASENEIHFDGLTLIKIDDKTCKHVIRLSDKTTGGTKDVEIVYHRED